MAKSRAHKQQTRNYRLRVRQLSGETGADSEPSGEERGEGNLGEGRVGS